MHAILEIETDSIGCRESLRHCGYVWLSISFSTLILSPSMSAICKQIPYSLILNGRDVSDAIYLIVLQKCESILMVSYV